MKINLDALLVLDTIHSQGSFAAAAEELHRVPSAITYTIKKLEQDLDTPLFNRNGHRAVLTEAGKLLLEQGRHLLDAASELENQVKKVSAGWETQLYIAINEMLPVDGLLDLIKDFQKQQSGTRIKLLSEVYGGLWDALVSERADLVIGAPLEGPTGGGYHKKPFHYVDWIFVVSANHPLADVEEPLTENMISQYPVIAVADTSRRLSPRTAGVFSGQDIFTVFDFDSKIKAQIKGLGVGFLPTFLIQKELQSGELIEKPLETGLHRTETFTAWKTGKVGRSLQWFLDNLSKSQFF